MAEGGTGSETTNHIAGMVVQNEILLTHGARVILVPTDFHPLTDTIPGEMTDTTDFFGRYRIEEPRRGDYQIEIHYAITGKRAHVGAFNFPGGHQTVPVVNLECPGVLKVTLPESLWAAGGYVYIPGTTFKTVVGESRVTILASLPAMRAPVVAYAESVTAVPRIIARDVWIGSLDTTEIPPPSSGHEAVLLFVTTLAGAAVRPDVLDFPVLVRLDTSNFDFSQTPDGSAGISFRKPDGMILPFEVERWDNAAAKAEIWVRMDTVKGNSNSQELIMRWGESPLPASPPATPVFDGAGGYAGVWHLGGSSGDRPDASGNGRTGIPHGFDGDESIEGVVGAADFLDRSDDLVDIGVINVARTISISAWIRPTVYNQAWSRILHKPFASDTLPWDAYSLQFGESGSKPRFNVADMQEDECPTDFGNVIPGAWVHLYGVYDGVNVTAYLNGRPNLSFRGVVSGDLHQNDRSTVIGAFSILGENKYSGAVDEVRIERVARSAAWIKLSYESQMNGRNFIRRIR